MGFLDWLLGKGGEVCDGDPRLAEAVARVIDATDPRLRRFRRPGVVVGAGAMLPT